jgi:hypothetical protein
MSGRAVASIDLTGVPLLERVSAARRVAATLGSAAERELVLSYALWPELPDASPAAARAARVERAVELRRAGLSFAAIAGELRVGYGSAWRFVNVDGGGDPRPCQRRPPAGRRERDERARRAVQLRARGYTLARIARALRVSYGVAWVALNVRAVELGLAVPTDVVVVAADGRRYGPRSRPGGC